MQETTFHNLISPRDSDAHITNDNNTHTLSLPLPTTLSLSPSVYIHLRLSLISIPPYTPLSLALYPYLALPLAFSLSLSVAAPRDNVFYVFTECVYTCYVCECIQSYCLQALLYVQRVALYMADEAPQSLCLACAHVASLLCVFSYLVLYAFSKTHPCRPTAMRVRTHRAMAYPDMYR